MTVTAPISLDQLDAQLVCELEANGRLGYLELAAKLDTSPRTVARRMKRLFDERIISSVTVTDPLVFGFRIRAGFGINARPDNVDAIARQLSAFRCITQVIITSGRYDVVAWGFFREPGEVVDFVSGKLGGIPDVVDTETMIFLRFYKDSWTYSGRQPDVLNQSDWEYPGNIDDADMAIIKALELEPRKSVTDIARQLGMSRTPVQRRLTALLTEGVIKIIGHAKPPALGFSQMSLILVKVNPSQIVAVAEKASSYRDISYVSVISGSFDISMAGVFRDSQEMYRFIKDELGTIPGVIRCESMHIARFVKRSYGLVS